MVVPATFWINERVAHEVLRALSENYLDPEGCCSVGAHRLQFKWALEGGDAAQVPHYANGWEQVRVGRRTGHAWEQLDLAWFQPNDWLLNLCNTGPLLRKQQLIFFHDAQVYAIAENFDWKFRWWYQLVMGVAGRRSQGLLTNSEFSKSELVRYAHLKHDKLTVMHLGTDHMRRLTPSLDSALADRIAQRPFVLAVSSASPNKNFAGVVQALQQVDPAPLCVIVGQQYSKVFKSDGLTNKQVIQAGYVSDETLAALYQQARCLVYPSFYEGFGLPPLEAMRMGCPVVVSNTSSLPEVCGQAAYYCDPQDPASIARSISTVLKLQQNPQAAERLRQESLIQAQSFTWKKSAHTLVQALVRALDAPNN
jgi:glycosyltransferase involved in cell wall biosynthesis